MTHHITLFLLIVLTPLTASAQNKCDAQAEAEQNRIIRKLESQPPSKHDQEAYLAWSKNMNAALAAVAQRPDAAELAATPLQRRAGKAPLSRGGTG